MGDIIMASGILPALKNAYPHATITWLVQKEFSELILGSPYVDKIISFDRKGLSNFLKEKNLKKFFKHLFVLIKEIRAQHFDLVLDLQGIWKSTIWTLISKAEEKIVVEPKEGVGFLFSKKVISPHQDKRLGAEYRTLLKFLGIGDESFGLGVDISKKHSDTNYVVFCPFTTRKQKFWIDEYWRGLIQFIKRKGLKVVVLGGPKDRMRMHKIFSDESWIIDMVGKLSIKESLGIISSAKAVVGVDTGLTHGSMLLKKPTIAIFGSTCPYLYPGYKEGVVLYENLSCSPCKRNPICAGKFHCMREITPDKVIYYLEKWI
jgi:heptosyltransferase-1